jgi:hypothetical protein
MYARIILVPLANQLTQILLIRSLRRGAVREGHSNREYDTEAGKPVISMTCRTVITECARTGLAQIAKLLPGFHSHNFSVLIQHGNRKNKLNMERMAWLTGITKKARAIMVSMMAVTSALMIASPCAMAGKVLPEYLFEFFIRVDSGSGTVGKLNGYRKYEFVTSVFANAAALLNGKQCLINSLRYRGNNSVFCTGRQCDNKGNNWYNK